MLRFEAEFEMEIMRLHEALKSHSYVPGPYRAFKVYDPKERLISAAPFRDRVIHHALCRVIEPIFERSLIFDTYANRKTKGVHAAIRRCQRYSRQFQFVLKGDIRKYFPSIDHEILKNLIRKKIKCEPTLQLIDLIIDNSNQQEDRSIYFPGDDLFTPFQSKKGIPMGNLTSQFFANLYLSPFDHFIKQELGIKGYIRYVDDFVLFHDQKSHLHEARGRIVRFLGEQLRLQVHSGKTQVSPANCGITFLGQRIWSTHRRLRRENVVRMKRRIKKNYYAYREGEMHRDNFELRLNSWLGHAGQANTRRLRKKILHNLRDMGLELAEHYNGHWVILEEAPEVDSIPYLYFETEVFAPNRPEP